MGEVVDQEHLAGYLTPWRGDEAGDVEMPSDCAGLSPVGTGGHDGQWLVENTAGHVAPGQDAPRHTQKTYELPPRLVHFERQLFDQAVVLVVADIQVSPVFGQHARAPEGISASVIGVAHHDGVIAVRAG